VFFSGFCITEGHVRARATNVTDISQGHFLQSRKVNESICPLQHGIILKSKVLANSSIYNISPFVTEHLLICTRKRGICKSWGGFMQYAFGLVPD